MNTIDLLDIPEAVVTTIMAEIVSAPGDFEGLLFGTNVQTQKLEYDDQKGEVLSITNRIVIKDFINLGNTSICGDDQQLNINFLSSLTSPNNSLIGWMCARRESPLQPSLRERMIQKKLFAWMSQKQNPNDLKCVFGIWSTSANTNRAVRAYDYRHFLTDSNQIIRPVSLRVLSQSESSTKEYSSFVPTTDSTSLKYLGFQNFMTNDIPQVREMERNCQTILQIMEEKVNELVNLERQVLQARTELRAKQKAKDAKLKSVN
eukprot:c33705_g1_i1.p1 GENE.c33705_g1_i1~~c33705_g1_i1.p1  ORF type:complete len:261 (-),score=74.70 c33705_g1_i1:25-807(-)